MMFYLNGEMLRDIIKQVGIYCFGGAVAVSIIEGQGVSPAAMTLCGLGLVLCFCAIFHLRKK